MRRFAVTLAAVLVTAQLALAQCGPGGCPSPYGGQIWGGNDRGGIWPYSQPESARAGPVSRTTPPEWLAHVYGASGMLIYKDERVGVVLTAYHVIRGGPRTGIRVRFPNGKTYEGRVYEATAPDISADKLYDCACIEIAAPKAEPVPMARVKPDVGARVWVVGYGGGRYRTRSALVKGYTRGTWTGGGSDAGTMRLHRGQAAIGGDSGGALLNGKGELVGVISTSDRNSVTNGPSLARIHALCSDERFEWPWLGWRKKAEQRIEGLHRDKADRSEIPLPPPPSPDPGRLERIEQKIDDVKLPPAPSAEIGVLADVIDANTKADEDYRAAWTPLLERLKAAEQKLLAYNPDKLKTDLGRELQADSKTALAKAEEAAKAVDKVTEAIGPAATTAAEAAIEKAEPGLIELASERAKEYVLSEGLIPGNQVPVWLKAIIFSHTGAIVLVVIALIVLAVAVAMRRVPGFKEAVRGLEDRAADAIPGRWDNALLAMLQGLNDRMGQVVTKLESGVGVPPPVYEQPQQPQAPVKRQRAKK